MNRAALKIIQDKELIMLAFISFFLSFFLSFKLPFTSRRPSTHYVHTEADKQDILWCRNSQSGGRITADAEIMRSPQCCESRVTKGSLVKAGSRSEYGVTCMLAAYCRELTGTFIFHSCA